MLLASVLQFYQAMNNYVLLSDYTIHYSNNDIIIITNYITSGVMKKLLQKQNA